MLPALEKPLYSTSCVVFNSESLYTVGGTDTRHKEVKIFQRLNLNEPQEWEVLPLKLPQTLCNIGLCQVELNQLLIFGGFSSSKAGATTLVCNMLESEGGQLILRKVGDGKAGSLQTSDIFLFNGVARVEEESKDFYLVGKDHVHVYNESTHKFRTLRQIHS